MGRGIPDFRVTGLANVSQCPITVDRGSPLRHAFSCDLFFRCVSAVMYSFPKPFLAHGENLETCRVLVTLSMRPTLCKPGLTYLQVGTRLLSDHLK